MRFSCAILAGGMSRRMGYDKATAKFRGETLITHVYNVAKKVFDDVMIVTSNHSNLKGIRGRILKDIIFVRSPITGIVTSLIESSTEYTFILACDMPFVTEESMRYVIENLSDEDIVIPKTEKGFEPLHALYKRSCIPFLLRSLYLGKMKIQSIFPYLQVRILENNLRFYNGSISVFTNINTKEDLIRFSKSEHL
ncbi:MAG: molybdenum cofactor guanylyltransferase [Deltaproteobacteria bacterium]|nr:molybdenum cofactor guanylyltransferase [Deltaproteobacteria bacterium]